MTLEMLTAKAELKELVDAFSNLADTKDAQAQGELFTPDGVLEFQMGFDGETQKIAGRRHGLLRGNACKRVRRQDCYDNELCSLPPTPALGNTNIITEALTTDEIHLIYDRYGTEIQKSGKYPHSVRRENGRSRYKRTGNSGRKNRTRGQRAFEL